MRRAFASVLLFGLARVAGAQTAPEAAEPVVAEPVAVEGYTPPAPESGLSVNGYVDVGFAKAQGDGTSFSPSDQRVPLDYGSDAFQPAVNSRGDVASTNTNGRVTNHFLPYTVGIGGNASFLINTVDLDLRYQPSTLPILAFVRAQALPRFEPGGPSTSLLVEQAFLRISPFTSQEFAVSIGKFDPVFGIEYLENEAPLRTNVTPSLIARYTTGQQLGAKALYRRQIPALDSAVSINAAVTNNSPEVEALQPSEVSLTGTPVASVRLGYELGLPFADFKLGASGMVGPRNDQTDPGVMQSAYDVDGRLIFGDLTLAAEYLKLDQTEGTSADKLTGTGEGFFATGFHVHGWYAELALGHDLGWGPIRRATVYGIYSRRHAQFDGFTPITVDRFTPGFRIDLWESVAVKAEYLFNSELAGAPSVPNDVFTSSLVFSW